MIKDESTQTIKVVDSVYKVFNAYPEPGNIKLSDY